ncbi:uncharacterized protein LOC142317533 [Lycorma delicatula]|uniref:uncharacterized protein LOC142317533 n=1 Tax=Lycorma delicatula TaxID=130591 RepID=UPI003F517C23
MAESRFSSPARSVGEASYFVDSEPEETIELVLTEVTSTPDLTLIDGYLKFRDLKRWKPRWGALTKLSPAAELEKLVLTSELLFLFTYFELKDNKLNSSIIFQQQCLVRDPKFRI